MSDTPTPRTDYAAFANSADPKWEHVAPVDMYDFARQLERELASVTADRDEAKESLRAWLIGRASLQHDRDQSIKARDSFEQCAKQYKARVAELESTISTAAKGNQSLAERLEQCEYFREQDKEGWMVLKARSETVEQRVAELVAALESIAAGDGDERRRAEDALARAESAAPAKQSPAIDAESLIAACIPGGSICDPQQVADAIREYLHQQEPCGGRCGDPECDLDTNGVTMRTPAPHADTVREWKTGTPDVPVGAMRRLWCAVLADNCKTYHSMLCYANGYAMQLADLADEIPDCCEPIPGDEDNLAWFGWYEESCDHCETQWHSSANVIAWMELPKFDAAMKGGAK